MYMPLRDSGRQRAQRPPLPPMQTCTDTLQTSDTSLGLEPGGPQCASQTAGTRPGQLLLSLWLRALLCDVMMMTPSLGGPSGQGEPEDVKQQEWHLFWPTQAPPVTEPAKSSHWLRSLCSPPSLPAPFCPDAQNQSSDLSSFSI